MFRTRAHTRTIAVFLGISLILNPALGHSFCEAGVRRPSSVLQFTVQAIPPRGIMAFHRPKDGLASRMSHVLSEPFRKLDRFFRGSNVRLTLGSDGIIRIPFGTMEIEIPADLSEDIPAQLTEWQSLVLPSALSRDPLPPGSRVLVYGSGSGILLAASALQGASSITAIDSDPEQVRRTRRTADHYIEKGWLKKDQLSIQQSDGHALEGSFDIILISPFEPGEGTPGFVARFEEIQSQLEHARDLLAPGGAILLRMNTDNPRWPILFQRTGLDAETIYSNIRLASRHSLEQGTSAVVRLRPASSLPAMSHALGAGQLYRRIWRMRQLLMDARTMPEMKKRGKENQEAIDKFDAELNRIVWEEASKEDAEIHLAGVIQRLASGVADIIRDVAPGERLQALETLIEVIAEEEWVSFRQAHGLVLVGPNHWRPTTENTSEAKTLRIQLRRSYQRVVGFAGGHAMTALALPVLPSTEVLVRELTEIVQRECEKINRENYPSGGRPAAMAASRWIRVRVPEDVKVRLRKEGKMSKNEFDTRLLALVWTFLRNDPERFKVPLSYFDPNSGQLKNGFTARLDNSGDLLAIGSRIATPARNIENRSLKSMLIEAGKRVAVLKTWGSEDMGGRVVVLVEPPVDAPSIKAIYEEFRWASAIFLVSTGGRAFRPLWERMQDDIRPQRLWPMIHEYILGREFPKLPVQADLIIDWRNQSTLSSGNGSNVSELAPLGVLREGGYYLNVPGSPESEVLILKKEENGPLVSPAVLAAG